MIFFLCHGQGTGREDREGKAQVMCQSIEKPGTLGREEVGVGGGGEGQREKKSANAKIPFEVKVQDVKHDRKSR